MQVNKEAVRMLVKDVGYTKASTQTGIKRDTLYQWAKRYQWNTPIVHSQETVRTVRPVSDTHADILAEMGERTRTNLAKAHSKAAAHAAGLPAEKLIEAKTAQAVRLHGQGAGLVHNWEAKQGQTNVMVNVALLGIDPTEVQASARVIEDDSGVSE